MWAVISEKKATLICYEIYRTLLLGFIQKRFMSGLQMFRKGLRTGLCSGLNTSKVFLFNIVFLVQLCYVLYNMCSKRYSVLLANISEAAVSKIKK